MSKQRRKSLSKKVRFEVFKRDSFACQYCGRRAPDVVLEVDHIEPVASGGGDGILNLVTSCESCNSGKGARELSDDAAVRRQMEELSKLNSRREQLRMILRWKRELEVQSDALVDSIADRWCELAPSGGEFSLYGKGKIRGMASRYSIDVIHRSMEIAAAEYLDWEKAEDGSDVVTAHSWGAAFLKVERICARLKETDENPHMADVRHILNIMRKRGLIERHGEAEGMVEQIVLAGVLSPSSIKQRAREAETLYEFERMCAHATEVSR